MKLFVIADPDTYLAFDLAGVEGVAVESEDDVPGLLNELDRASFGLILITETLAAKQRKLIDAILLEPGGPLILEIPDIEGPKVRRLKPAERLLSLMKV